METATSPITLHPFTLADAERLLGGDVDPLDGWEGGYSFTDEPELLAEYIRAVREDGDPAPSAPISCAGSTTTPAKAPPSGE
ncbi:hypothetical protein [Agromyces marinus]|uniref:hypothetical protein n=1 Tax=Agromyces marinus TaxID=1389020 RepID=UPI0025726A4E|nr:hypothetical protein [Agromyces marinus]